MTWGPWGRRRRAAARVPMEARARVAAYFEYVDDDLHNLDDATVLDELNVALRRGILRRAAPADPGKPPPSLPCAYWPPRPTTDPTGPRDPKGPKETSNPQHASPDTRALSHTGAEWAGEVTR